MKKLLFVLLSSLAMFCLVITLTAQDEQNVAQPSEEEQEEAQTASEEESENSEEVQFENILVDDFEDAGAWQAKMARDLGVVRLQRREGGPKEVREGNESSNKYMLAAKTSYMRTGTSSFTLSPPRDIAIMGETKNLSVWVAGRNFSHKLVAVVRDFFNEKRYISFGSLTFYGWRKLYAAVPESIRQNSYKYASGDRPRGIKFSSFLINCSMDETVGDYYVYFDNLEALSDTFWENESNRDPYDPRDNW